MNSKQLGILDCKVEVRKYVLVSQPSRWRQKSERVVVQSPMLKITESVSVVPVKRYKGEEQNSVCFIPKEDIEKDTSKIYDKTRVSTGTSWVDAHGVALFDSSVHDQIIYLRGDPFWICIGASTKGYEQIVPVINLRTYEKGDVDIEQVCWYPKIQGPNQELWTPGGETRKLKQGGTGEYSHWCWVVCQKLDGTPPTTKTVEIPTNEVNMKDRRLLSISETRSLFEKRKRFVDEGFVDYSECRPCSLPTYIPRNQIFILPTPLASSDQHLSQCSQPPNRATLQPQQQRPLIRAWRGIFEMADRRGPRNGKYILRNSLIHPQKIARFHMATRRQLLHSTKIFTDDVDMGNEASTCYSTRESSLSRSDSQDEELFSHDLPTLGSDVYGAALLVEICRKDKGSLQRLTKDQNCPKIPPIEADIYTGHKSFRDEYERNMEKFYPNPILTARCSLKDPQCAYTRLSTTIHYHCSPDKCHLSKPTLPSDLATSDHDSTIDHNSTIDHDPNHEHCVSLLGPYPDSAGECLLANSLYHFPNHTCCDWKLEDLAIIYDDRKLIEAKMKNKRIYDRAWMSEQLDAGGRVTIRGCDLGSAGRKLMDDLRSGEWDKELGDLPIVIDSRVYLTDDLSTELGLGVVL